MNDLQNPLLFRRFDIKFFSNQSEQLCPWNVFEQMLILDLLDITTNIDNEKQCTLNMSVDKY